MKPVAVVVPVSGLTRSGIPETALDAYREAAAGAPNSCDIDWSLLAAIGRVESNHGRFGGAKLHTDGESAPPILGPVLDGTGTALITDTDDGALDGDSVHDRAVGPMQFIPSTWRLYGRDGNDDGRKDPFNIYDATAAAAAYLCRAGGDLSTVAGQSKAVFAYNHSATYVATVLNLAAAYAGTPPPVIPSTPAEEAPAPPVNPAPPPAVEQEAVAAASSAPSDPTPSPTETTAPPSTAAAAVIPASPPTDPTATTPAATTTDTTTPPATPTDATAPPATETTTPPADTELTTPPADTTTAPAETTTAPATTTDTTTLPATTTDTTTPPTDTTTPPTDTTTPPADTTTAPVDTTTPPADTTTAPTDTTTTTAEATTTTAEATTTTAEATTPSPSETTTSTPPATTTAAASDTPAPEACPAVTVDVLDTTGDPAAAAAAIGSLAAPGVVVGTITTGAAEPSGIEFPAAAWADAERFGQATGAWKLLRTADVPHVTVVLGADGLQPLLAALKAFPGLTCP